MDTRTRTLTFGDDGSAGADVAWEWIAAHAWPQWSLEVVTVTLPKSHSVTSPLGYTELRPWEPPDPRQAPASCGFQSVAYLAADNDPRLILGKRKNSDLVVVGPRGHGMFGALLVGSTTEWLLRCPTTPLLIARQPVATGSIIVCVDGSNHARAAVDFLATMPWLAGVPVTVLGVVERDDDLAAAVAAATDVLTAAGADVTPVVVEPDPLALTINPRVTIFEHMDRQDPDLVVLGTSGRTGLARMWLGSVASAVSHHAHCSTLAVRDRHGDDRT
jgi:nucleotide-binding universal stress UspA family protein